MSNMIPNNDSLLLDPLHRRDEADEQRRIWLDERADRLHDDGLDDNTIDLDAAADDPCVDDGLGDY